MYATLLVALDGSKNAEKVLPVVEPLLKADKGLESTQELGGINAVCCACPVSTDDQVASRLGCLLSAHRDRPQAQSCRGGHRPRAQSAHECAAIQLVEGHVQEGRSELMLYRRSELMMFAHDATSVTEEL